MSDTTTGTSLVSIKQKYKTSGVHLLLPTVFEEQLNPFHKLSVMEVIADLTPDSGDVFKVGGQYVKKGDKDIWVEYFSPAKPLLMKIATAAGIQFNPNFTGVTSAGKNAYHGKAQGAIKLPDGTHKTHYDEKLINLDDEEGKFQLEFMDKSLEGVTGKAGTEAAKLFKGEWIMVEKKYGKPGEKERAYVISDADRQKFIDRSVLVNMVLLRKHAPQKALTGAILRVIRALIGMKSQYTTEELKKPFVLARVNFSPDFNDPEVRKAMLTTGMASMANIFGNNIPQIANQPVFVETDNGAFDSEITEDDPFISDSFRQESDEQEHHGSDDEGLPWNQQENEDERDEEIYNNDSESANPNVCSDCGIAINDKVSEFSHKRYGRYLCYKCQKGA
jgi:hypothetical protein